MRSVVCRFLSGGVICGLALAGSPAWGQAEASVTDQLVVESIGVKPYDAQRILICAAAVRKDRLLTDPSLRFRFCFGAPRQVGVTTPLELLLRAVYLKQVRIRVYSSSTSDAKFVYEGERARDAFRIVQCQNPCY
ncbi:hypothetical protein [Bordetella pseudohinzii]|uniref:Islet-activating protein S4 n=1 Tax=Bordetella pseudohinzii TaxID=1331258 RepID=A0A0J6BZ31_9BORD|nr:hypothetical protein [Bordetella pseudohinzii]ANY14719.1 hypothetical protein BBN53_01725 [Bordetella pseudohinzii]KMM26919.1 pertussis toxin subunit 4 [Bordetella pseudohinzii]KXA76230.1 hypothetical protein AW877_17410 [Bordetella pseudohinzii]KXA78116.1 hypothetical protein AW878_13595 [Bordetella pseudohinzii]CUI59729.1 Islet-activating protein S4 [Bordetella pseudohinzii]